MGTSLGNLPHELVEVILGFVGELDMPSLRRCCTVCKEWRNICRGNYVRRRCPDFNKYNDIIRCLSLPFVHNVSSLKVLLSCSSPLAYEIVKNLVIVGVGTILLLEDNTLVCKKDLASNLFLQKQDIGQPRTQLCAQRLNALNLSHVDIRVISKSLEAAINDANVVIIPNGIDYSWESLCRYSDLCHNRALPIPFIVSHYTPFISQVFVDFGSAWKVLDPNPQEPLCYLLIKRILPQDDGSFIIEIDEPTKVVPSEFGKGLTIKAAVRFPDGSRTQFFLVDPSVTNSELSNIVRVPALKEEEENLKLIMLSKNLHLQQGTLILSTHEPEICNHVPLRDIAAPTLAAGNVNNPKRIHSIFRALSMYREKWPDTQDFDKETLKGILAELYNGEDFSDAAEECWMIAKTVDKEFSPTCNVVGGIIAQEAMKATGIQTPLPTQFLFFSAMDLLESPPKRKQEREKDRENENEKNEEEREKEKENEDILSMIEGSKEVIEKLKGLKLLPLRRSDQNLEAVKCLVLLGACSWDAGGNILLARNPKRNAFHLGALNPKLADNKQDWWIAYIRQHRGSTGVKAVPWQTKYNNQLEESYKEADILLAGARTRHMGTLIARDHQNPIFGSAVWGTIGRTAMTIPFVTTGNVAFDTPIQVPLSLPARRFRLVITPNDIIRELLYGSSTLLFGLNELREAIEATNFEHHMSNLYCHEDLTVKGKTLLKLCKFFPGGDPSNVNACILAITYLVDVAVKEFDKYFYHKWKRSLEMYPPAITLNSGLPMWEAVVPEPLKFDGEDPIHIQFIHSVVRLWLYMYGIDLDPSIVDTVLSMEHEYPVTQTSTRVSKNENDVIVKAKKVVARLRETCPFTMRELPMKRRLKQTRYTEAYLLSGGKLLGHVRGADPPNLFYIRSELWNKMPKLCSTASILGGLTVIEIIKYLQGKPLTELHRYSINAASSEWKVSNPPPSEVHISGPNQLCIPERFTEWDVIEIRHPEFTIQDLSNYCVEKYGFRMTCLADATNLIYNDLLPRHIPRKTQQIVDIWRDYHKNEKLPECGHFRFTVIGELESGEDVDTPDILFYFGGEK